ncbi:two-component system, NarL family, sensor histidine kinase DesK [Jiangella alba]|uniref:Two-component system, NarL family, sensor histidine kinase DesK n=2 Tax=Jiangella alba TaxID=561176 RepID=A0A1H5LJR6_9ACTN|nr:two-component system, NarL family, sensor histidine kinase DesK [Jiangella alba]
MPVSMVSRWWEERSAPQRFDLYTRGTLYSMLAGEPLVALLIASSSEDLGSAAQIAGFVALAAVHAGIGVVVLRGGLAWYLGRGAWPYRWTVALLAVTVCAAAAAVAAFGWSAPPEPGVVSGAVATQFAVIMLSGFTVGALAPRLDSPRLTLIALLFGTVIAGVGYLSDWPRPSAIGTGLAAVFAYLGGWSAFRASVWMLGIVWELDRSRQVQADLAVAEERLRFARDLHDILGRNLSVIAVKSELAAALSRRGRDDAGDEMMAVRDIAQESLREVREVVRGYREVDLTTELAGARSVLRSAGVATRVVGEVSALPPDVQAVLGWVAREGTTNVLRHSSASTCVITVARSDGSVTLTMENDGAREPSGASGSGLSGLAERLSELGGSLTADRLDGDRFRLSAQVPSEVAS